MFTKEIQQTTFTTDIAGDLFKNIRGGSYRSDYSFISTMRALLFDRMNNDEEIDLHFTDSHYSISQLESASSKADAMNSMLAKIIKPDISENQLLIHSLNGTDNENNSAVLEFIRKNIAKVYGDGYVRTEDLSLFVKKLVQADFYINEKQRVTIVVGCNLDVRKLHMMQSFISRLLPWFFKDRKPLEDDEKALLISLTKTSAVDYATLIEQAARKFDFRSAQIKKLLPNFETAFERQQLENLGYELSNIENELSRLERDYSAALRRKDDNLTLQLGINARLGEQKESEIMDYFLCNTSLHLQRVQGFTLEFIAETYLDNYDPEMFERMIDNSRSVFYDYQNNKFDENAVRELLTGIFGEDAQLKIKVCAAYKIDIENMNARGLSDYRFPASLENHLPNQHIQRHSCLGSNSQYIQKCLQNRDYILAIEQCVASARNFNMGDSTVANEFMQKIFSPSAKKFILLPDGTSCTPIKALEWLRANKETEVEKDEQTD